MAVGFARGHDVDVDELEGVDTSTVLFIVAGDGALEERERIPADKRVLINASPAFAARMEERWAPGDSFQLPPQFSVQAARTFVNALHVGKISKEDPLEVLVEVLRLAEMYWVQGLLHRCAKRIKGKITRENAHEVWAMVQILRENHPDIHALNELCLNQLVHLVDHESSQEWHHFLWKQILERDEVGPNTELQLFQRLVKWGQTEGRKFEFTSLVRLIRFPLIEEIDLLKFVKPTGLISLEEIAELRCYYSGGGVSGNFPSMFNTKPRGDRQKVARTNYELIRFLEEARPGDWIQLVEGTYDGDYDFLEDFYASKVHIQGAGKDLTKIKLNFNPNSIRGRFVTLSDLSLYCPHWKNAWSIRGWTPTRLQLGDNTLLRNVGLHAVSLTINGSNNTLENLTFSIPEKIGRIHENICVASTASNNTIRNVVAQDSKYGIIIKGNQNTVEGLECVNVKRNVCLSGIGNNVAGV